jgi:hypothetical protein
MSLYRELEQLDLAALTDRFGKPAPEGEEYAAVYYEELASLIRRQGEKGASFLWAEINAADNPRLRAILFALTEPPNQDPRLKERLLSYLNHPEPMIIAEAVDGLARINANNALHRVQRLHGHPSPYVRGAVLRYLRHVDPEQALPVLIDALKDADFIVRENAADELGELRAVEAIPHLRLAEKDPHPDVREAARTAIEIFQSIAGEETKEDGDDRIP